ncbi:MAG: hypothetical protein WBE93_04810 [Pseudolabrys sp.]
MGFHLLLDLRELHELLRELIGVEWIQRFWFFSCVVNSCRNVVKLPAISVLSSAFDTEPAPVAVEAGLIVVMCSSSNANIETAALSGKAVVNLRCHIDRRQQFVLHDELGGVRAAVGLLLVCGLIAQREL